MACCLRRRRFSRSAAARRSAARGSDLRAPAGAGLAGDGASWRLASSWGALIRRLLSFMGSPAGPGGSGLVDRGDRPGGKGLFSEAMAIDASPLTSHCARDPAPQTTKPPFPPITACHTPEPMAQAPRRPTRPAPVWPCCGSSVVEHSIGNGEVESSILSRSTSYSNKINVLEKSSVLQSSILRPYAILALAAQSPHTVK